MARRMRWLGVILVLGAVAACATPPLPQPEGEPLRSPGEVVTEGLPATEQIWGGVISGIRHREDATRLEVVAYPLRDQAPQTQRSSEGRFRLEVDAFLEPLDYRVGRRITAVGSVERIETGRIGEAEVPFPVMRARALHLWPEAHDRDPGRVRFGIGIGIGL